MDQAYQLLKDNLSFELTEKWLKLGKRNIRLINKFFKVNKNKLSVYEKKRITSTLGILKALNTKINQLRKKGRGTALSSQEEIRIRWEDLETAFQNRIKTGSIVNLTHIDLKHFLEDAKLLTIKKINCVLKKNPNLKINVILYGKFKTLVEGKMNEAIKHFNTKNDIISKSTDLDAWYDEKVKDQL